MATFMGEDPQAQSINGYDRNQMVAALRATYGLPATKSIRTGGEVTRGWQGWTLR